MSNYLTQRWCIEGPWGDQLRTALIDSVTHEFRSPLTSIKAAMTALSDMRVRPWQRNELLSIINEEADRLSSLVGDAVEASRLDAHVKLHLRPHVIAAIVEAAKKNCNLQRACISPCSKG